MREKNMRLVMAGGVLVVLAWGFFLFMTLLSSKSNDPIAMMQTVGQVTGIATAIGIVLAVLGFVGKKKG